MTPPLHALVFAGPILLSTDVFSYIAYARMGVEHGINPYTHGPLAILHDPVYRYVQRHWELSPAATTAAHSTDHERKISPA